MTMTSRIDAVIDDAIARRTIVGAVVMVAHEGETVYARAAGLADREQARPVGIDTIFRLASVTKPIVAATGLAMVERGLMSLDQPVTDFLPWFTPSAPDGSKPQITLHQLLTHTAGIVYGGPDFERIGVNGGLVNTDRTLEENLRLLAQVPLASLPGTKWEYSKGIDVIGGVIEAIEGTSLGAAVHRYVTGPLGMEDTDFRVTDPSRLARAYGDGTPEPELMHENHAVPARDGNGAVIFSPDRIFNPRAFHSGGAGMAGTAPDLLKFLETLRRGGDPILKPETVNDGMSNQIDAIPRREKDAGQRFGFFGAVVEDPALAGVRHAVGTVTWGGVYGNHWFIDPANGVSVIMLSNTAVEGCDGPYRDRLRDAVYPVLDEA